MGGWDQLKVKELLSVRYEIAIEIDELAAGSHEPTPGMKFNPIGKAI